ncbi:MAG: c-type cytochrome biogenesis protein CcmI, partial [Alphaproteobacteria bacterium]|nr:c-type cytochrome biogenesis protein CcmI [Alphaproteobacteria bacterium]
RDQLTELDREHREGRLLYVEAEAAKAEISRRILAADAARKGDGGPGEERHPAAAVLLAVLLVGSAVTGYIYTGSPNQPSHPYAEREDERKQRTAGTRGQQMNLSDLADRLKKRLNEDADSVQGWQLLARTYMTMGNFAEAVPAFEQLIALNGADSGTFASYGEAISLAAQGSVTPKSQAAFREALAKNFKEPTARFYLALADWQGGEHRKAYDGWLALMAETPVDATWAGVLQQRLTEASEKLGLDVAALPKLLPPSGPPESASKESAPGESSIQHPGGPTAEDVTAAQKMLPTERQEMIRGMVAGLAAKLEGDPANFEGWKRLIRSYSVLGEKLLAKEALDKALAQFTRAPFVKRQLLALGQEFDLDDAPAASASEVPRGPSAEDIRAAQEMNPEEQSEMIEGMVAQLASRLAENPNDLQGWIRLGRSYNVLGKPNDARDALAKAAKVAPGNVDILILYARTIRTAAGNKPTATSIEVMQKVLTLQPANVEALFFSGLAASGAGDKAEARRLWEKAQSGLPEDSKEREALQRQIDDLNK